MIGAFKYIQNVGRFKQVEGRDETRLGALTLVYSENGRGKTTLCAILRSLTTGSPDPILERRRLSATSEVRSVLELDGSTHPFDGSKWSVSGPRIVVFDDHFVDANVHSGLSVGAEHRKGVHELVVGEEGVRFQKRVEELTVTISTLQNELRQKERAIPAAALGSLSVDDFCSLARIENLEAEIENAERSLTVARDAEAIRSTVELRPFALPQLNLSAYESLLDGTLADLEAAAVDAVQQHLATLGTGSERWAAEGLTYLGVGTSCPFCRQDAAGSTLIAHYRAYFSDSYDQHKRRIQEMRDRAAASWSGDRLAQLQRNLQQEKEKRDFWQRYIEVPTFDVDFADLANAWALLRDALLDALDAKAGTPLESIALSPQARDAAQRYQKLAGDINELAAALAACNAAVAQTKEHAAEGSASAAQQRLERLRAIQRRFAPATDEACREFMRARNDKAAAEREKEDARAALDEHRERVFGTYEVAINRFLDTFNANFTLQGLQPSDRRGVPSSTYSVAVNGCSVGLMPTAEPAPSFSTVLSAGDRNTLALAFFFASLERIDLRETIVVIDDPISSLDDARAFATVQEIRRLEGRCRQLIVLSHSRTLLCQLWERADKNGVATLRIRDAGPDGSTLDSWDAEAAATTEFDRLYHMVSSYVEDADGDPQKVAPALRVLLESYLRVGCVPHFPPGWQLGDFIQRARQLRIEGKAILAEEAVQELRELNEYARLFHHSTNQRAWLEVLANLNEQELRGFARRVLRFITDVRHG
jgi:wobble nucleotide-excising tRNase